MIELRISPGGRRFLAWKTDQTWSASSGPEIVEVEDAGRAGCEAFQKSFRQLQREKNQLYAEIGRGRGDGGAFEAIYERIGAQMELLSAKIAAEAQPRQVSKALVPVASTPV